MLTLLKSPVNENIPFLRNYEFSKFCGLTEKEVKELLKKFNITERMGDVRSWYDGYKGEKSCITIYRLT